MWATIYLFLPIHPSILTLSYLLQYMVRIIFKKIQLFLFWNGSVITPTQGKCSQTNAFSNVRSLHDTSTVSLVETHVRLADPESYFCLSPFVLCHHETDVPGHQSVGSQCQTMEEAQQTPEHRSPVASRALSPSVPTGCKSRCQATRGLPRCPLGGRTMQSKTLRSWHWKHLQFFQHQWKHGSSAAWRAGDAELAQPQHCQWKMPVLGCHSGPLTSCAGVTRLGVCDFHKPLDSPSAQKDFWTLSLRALKEQEHHPRPQDRIKWQVCCAVALEEGTHAGQWGTRWPEQREAHTTPPKWQVTLFREGPRPSAQTGCLLGRSTPRELGCHLQTQAPVQVGPSSRPHCPPAALATPFVPEDTPLSTPPPFPAEAPGSPCRSWPCLLFPSPENRTFISCWDFWGNSVGFTVLWTASGSHPKIQAHKVEKRAPATVAISRETITPGDTLASRALPSENHSRDFTAKLGMSANKTQLPLLWKTPTFKY